ncbi:2-oxoacid:acceptor oxidoreductase family protein [candidate division KSB1 bacterium]|nr:2-oxoacid:acceptor oxidoreductase family protein [candidate division KSB1 bacterium]
MSRIEVRVSGFGGQGIILSGRIIGMAAAIYESKQATFNQSYGPEARGSACSAQVVISDELIHYPYLSKTDILVAMSQEAYQKFEPDLLDNGLLLIESDLVKVNSVRKGIRFHDIPATRLAEELGRKIVANIVMLGFFTAMGDVFKPDSMKQAMLASVPKGTEELNLKAFSAGYDYGMNLKKKSKSGAKAKG